MTGAMHLKPKDYQGEIQRARELISAVGDLPLDWQAKVDEWFYYGEPELALFAAFDYALKFQRPLPRSVVLEAVFGWFEPINKGAGYHYLVIPTDDDVDWSQEPIDIRPMPRDYNAQVNRARHLIAEVGELPLNVHATIEEYIVNRDPVAAVRVAFDYALSIQRPVSRLALIEAIHGWLDRTSFSPQSKYLRIPKDDPRRIKTEAVSKAA